MAHAHTAYYAETPIVEQDEYSITVKVGGARFVMRTDEAVALRDDLSRAITEAATAAAKAVQAEGAQA